jgi:hypothetical protein
MNLLHRRCLLSVVFFCVLGIEVSGEVYQRRDLGLRTICFVSSKSISPNLRTTGPEDQPEDHWS